MGIFQKFIYIYITIFWVINIIFWVTPDNIDPRITSLYASLKCTEIFSPYEDTDSIFNNAKMKAIYKVEKSKTITNKDHVIKRIKNSTASYHMEDDNIIWWYPNTYKMCYILDWYRGRDHILVRMSQPPNEKEDEFLHELNHLIDYHRNDKHLDNFDKLIKDDISVNEYYDFFKDWVDGEEIYKPVFESIVMNKDYLTNDKEVYARLSTLKSLFVELSIMRIDETLTIEHVNMYRDVVHKIKSERLINLSYELIDDTIMLLPLIDWSQTDALSVM